MLSNGNEIRREPKPSVTALESEADWREAGIVLQTLRPTLDVDKFLSMRDQLANDGYRLVGVRIDNKIASVASFTISPHAQLGRELIIHDMATKPEMQKQGCASILISSLIEEAKKFQCRRIFVHTRNAQVLYSRNGFEEYSTGMIKKLD